MIRFPQTIVVRWINAMQRRLVRARSGSVLILVVALLVILALIGTAWMAAARNDRYGSAQNATNTQIDLLVDGAIALVQGVVVDDLFGTLSGVEAYRPAGDAATTGYEHYDVANSPLMSIPSDTWLASRVPVDSGGVGWLALTAPFNSDSADATKRPYFHDPRNSAFTHFDIAPKQIAYPGSVVHDGKDFPALQIGLNTYLAADADGDGIADSVLWKLPIAPIDGVTYYVAYRVIDNNSAVNVNTAFLRDDDVNGTGDFTINGGFSPSSVGLAELLRTWNQGATNIDNLSIELTDLDRIRFNMAGNVRPSGVVGNSSEPEPYQDDGTSRPDFQFISFGDALYHQLGARLSNPGNNVGSDAYQSIGRGSQLRLAYHFCLLNPDASPEVLEQYLAESVYLAAPNAPGNSIAGAKAYPANQWGVWFDDNFNFELETSAANFRPRRTILTTSNPVSNLAQTYSMAAIPAGLKVDLPPTDADLMPNFTSANRPAPRTSVNTATFGELWRGYWSVMTAGGLSVPQVPAGTDVQMFRSTRRDPTATPLALTAGQMLLLRSALAAVNTMDLRDSDHDVTSRQVVLDDNSGGTVYTATVYGTERQPYITEVFANTDTANSSGSGLGPNPKGYVAIELYNPYPVDIDISGWQLGIIDRRTSVAYPLVIKAITGFVGFTAGTIVPANSHLVLENYDSVNPPVGSDALYRPTGAGTPVGTSILVSNLHEVFEDTVNSIGGGELVLLRPRRADNTLTSSTALHNTFDESISEDMVPVDSFDFTGLNVNGEPYQQVHYIRTNGSADPWEHVYPGRYTIANTPRHEAEYQTWSPVGAAEVEPAPSVPATLGADDTIASYSSAFPAIQLNNVDWAGPNAVAASGNIFPFGAFARNGDILQVPYVGAYRLEDVNGLVELNSVSMDIAFADDGDATNDADEQLGRFCPLTACDPTAGYTTDAYGWASDLLDCLTVQNPNDDYFPNVSPAKNDETTPPHPDTYKYLPANSLIPHFPLAVQNGGAAPAADQGVPSTLNGEDNVALQGLININTASWKVLAALPLLPASAAGADTDSDGVPDNIEALAKAIVYYRDIDDGTGSGMAHGPFTDLFELNKVPAYPAATIGAPTASVPFIEAAGGDPALIDFDDANGDISPLDDLILPDGPDGVIGDFEQRFLALNRISNMITTRSDSFTAYILIQGWRNAESNAAALVAQRRVGVILDRSGVTSTTTKGNLSTTRFPQN